MLVISHDDRYYSPGLTSNIHVQHQNHKSMGVDAYCESAGADEPDLLSLRRRWRSNIQ